MNIVYIIIGFIAYIIECTLLKLAWSIVSLEQYCILAYWKYQHNQVVTLVENPEAEQYFGNTDELDAYHGDRP